jgi:nicotinamidase/pyrazinamidase
MATNALIVTDLQNDFLPGGTLAVPGAEQTIPLVNRLMKAFDLVVATQDWHPRNHVSFAVNHPGHGTGDVIDAGGVPQLLWPVHCVQNAWGADFHPILDRFGIHEIVRKGADPKVDSYGAFRDNAARASTRLGAILRERGAEDVYIAGVATDYCVKATALDAAALGFRAHVILDACRGIEAAPGDTQRGVEEMKRAGVDILESADLPGRMGPTQRP